MAIDSESSSGINWSATRWIVAAAMFTLLFVMVAVVMGLMLGIERNSAYCEKFDTDTVTTSSGSMKEVRKSTLYPYSGGWNSREFGKTAAQCVDLCLADSTCLGFFRENENSSPANQQTCYFYTHNNTQAMVGLEVKVDPYFVGTELVVGAQLPEVASDTYLKSTTSWTMFRSLFNDAGVVQ